MVVQSGYLRPDQFLDHLTVIKSIVYEEHTIEEEKWLMKVVDIVEVDVVEKW